MMNAKINRGIEMITEMTIKNPYPNLMSSKESSITE